MHTQSASTLQRVTVVVGVFAFTCAAGAAERIGVTRFNATELGVSSNAPAVEGFASESLPPGPPPEGLPPSTQPPGEGQSCETLCDERSDEALDRCLAAGENPTHCERLAEHLGNRCLRECRERACLHRCQVQSLAVRQMCLDEGETEEACAERSRAFRRHCAAGCKPLGPREWCHLAARRAFAECTSNSLPVDECQQEADELLARCLNAPPASCAERCAIRADRFNAHCEEDQPEEVDCTTATDVFLGDCLSACEPVPCDVRCAARGTRVFRRCVAQGGDETNCQAAASDAVATCLDICAASDEEEAPADDAGES
jgi:hypothetical protein